MADLALEALLRCDACKAIPYRLYRRRTIRPDGSPGEAWEHQLWPASPDVPPPARVERIVCPACQRDLRRVAP